MFTEYRLNLTIDRLVGGIPRHPEIVRRWQEARWSDNPSATLDEAVTETVEELGSQALSEEQVEGIWTGFAEKDGHLVLEERNVKAMLKESANIVKSLPEALVRGKAIPLRSKLAERVYVHPKWIDLGVTEPTGTIERPIHVMTQRGPRTALKRTDYVDDVKLDLTLEVLDDGVITEQRLRLILDHASRNGLGTDRSQGNGTFAYTLE